MSIKLFLDDLSKCKYKYELNEICYKLSSYKLDELDIQNDDTSRLLQILRDKIYDIIIKNSDSVEGYYIGLFGIINTCYQDRISIDERYSKMRALCEEMIYDRAPDENQRAIFVELYIITALLEGANSKIEYQNNLKHILRAIMMIHLDSNIAIKLQENILLALEHSMIDMKDFIPYLRDVLEWMDMLLHSKIKEKNILDFIDIKRLRSMFNWQLHCFWNVGQFFSNTCWIELYEYYKKILYTLLNNIDNQTYLNISKEQYLDMAMYVEFFIYHICGNSYSTQEQWADFNKDISKKASARYTQYAKKINIYDKHQSSKEIIGILKDRIVLNSPFKVEYSLFKTLLENEDFNKRYKIIIYNMSMIEKSEDGANATKMLEDLGIDICQDAKFYNQAGFYNSHLNKALKICEQIRHDGVKYLISPNNGYGISDFILSSRVAFKQIYYSHGNFMYDIDEIDCIMTHICNSKSIAIHEGRRFLGVPIHMYDGFYNPSVDMDKISKQREKYKDKKILGTIGRLIKIDSIEYLSVICRLLDTYHSCIYLACGMGHTESIKEKISSIIQKEKLDAKIIDRFVMLGYVDSALYGHIIDIWLDSFPYEQGESRIEYMAKGNIGLVMSKESKENRKERLQALQKEANIKDDFNIDDLREVAFDTDDYEQKARNLIEMKEEEKIEILRNNKALENINKKLRTRICVDNFINILNS